jgi:lysophospholipase L1-like esterase
MESSEMKMNEPSLSRPARPSTRTRLPLFALTSLAFLLALTSCAAPGNYSNNAGGTTNFSSVVYMGDSLTAGYQNGSLLDTQQPNGYANVVASQANFRIKLPLIAPPGAPAVLELESVGPPPVITEASGTTPGRDDPTIVPTDVAVPGHFLYDVLNTYASPSPTTGQEQLTALVLGFPGLLEGTSYSQYTAGAALKPTTIFLWIGNNDALIADIYGSPVAMTDIDTFTTEYNTLIPALQATGAHLIIGNIPDVTLVPYLTPGAEVLAEVNAETGVPIAELEVLLGIQPDDLVNPTAVDEIPGILADPTTGPLTLGVLTPTDQAAIQAQVLAYNQVIATAAASAGATLVDIHSTFDTAYANGVTVNGYTGTFAFLGGLFALDGIHPTNTGYGVLANAFIDAIDTDLGASIKEADLSTIAKSDPYWTPNIKTSSNAPASKAIGPVERMSNGRYITRMPSYASAKAMSDAGRRLLPAKWASLPIHPATKPVAQPKH